MSKKNDKNYDIKLEHHKFTPPTSLNRGRLQIIFSGTDINIKILNSLRRTILKSIPTYAFPSELIQIKKIDPESGFMGSTAFNNDYMKVRLRQFPLIGNFLDTGLDMLHEEFWQDIDYLDREKVHEKEKKVEAYVSVKNQTDDIVHVTTNDMVVYVDGEKTEMYDKKYPFLVISLKPKEMFTCNMVAALGVGHRDVIWDSAGNCYYDEGETFPDKYLFTLESNMQYDEYNLFQKALKFIKKKLEALKLEVTRIFESVEKKSGKNIDKIELELKSIDHGLCGAVNYEIQSHKEIVGSGSSKRDLLVDVSTIRVESFDGNKLLSSILESIDILVNKFDEIESEFSKLVNKFNTKESNIKQSNTKESNKTKK